MVKENKISFKEDLEQGKITINKNGHINGLNGYDYERLLSRGEVETGDCYLCGEKTLHTMTREYNSDKPNHIEIFSWRYAKRGTRTIVNKRQCSMANHKKQENAFKINVPTGKLVIGNYFLDFSDDKYAFDIPEKSRYIKKYNISNIKGQNNRANYIAEKFNVGYVQVNSPIEVWLSKDKNKILFVLNPNYENDLSKEDKKFNKFFTKSHLHIGDLDQSVWRYEFADKSVIKDNKAIVSAEFESLKINIPKGRYVVKHHYGKEYFSFHKFNRYAIVTEIELVTTTREVLIEKSKRK